MSQGSGFYCLICQDLQTGLFQLRVAYGFLFVGLGFFFGVVWFFVCLFLLLLGVILNGLSGNVGD